jgi:hypothetical protein
MAARIFMGVAIMAVENPWLAEGWNLTAQGAYIRKYGLEVAKTKAKQAGTRIGDLQPKPLAALIKQYVMIKHVSDDTATQGSSGSGPPT